MTIGAEAALLDCQQPVTDDPQRVQRRLARGLCTQCGHPVPTAKYKRRSPLCETCWETWGWCSRGQHVAPRDQFATSTTIPHGIVYECKACRRQRSTVRPLPMCGRCHTRPVATSGRGRRKLCTVCLETHAWCNVCGPRLRREFTRLVRRKKEHARTCRRCTHVPPTENQLDQRRQQQAHMRAAAVAEAVANPLLSLATVAAHHGISTTTLAEAMKAAGVARGSGSVKQAQAQDRYAGVLDLSPAELAARDGISLKTAYKVRSLARRAQQQKESRDAA